MLDDGKTYRWELQIDGTDVPDADAQARRHTERRGWMVMVLVHGDEEVELNRWSTKTYKYGPAAVIRRLGDLR